MSDYSSDSEYTSDYSSCDEKVIEHNIKRKMSPKQKEIQNKMREVAAKWRKLSEKQKAKTAYRDFVKKNFK